MVRTISGQDVVVVGSGMAGLTAAVRAQELGADVALLEKGSHAGGSTYLSGGSLYTYDYEDMRRLAPGGDPVTQRIVAEGTEEAVEWLRDQDVPIEEPNLLETGRDGDWDAVLPELATEVDEVRETRTTHGILDTAGFVARMIETLEAGGGEFHIETPMTDILTDQDGAVRGVKARGPEDEPLEFLADDVVLATGGFQGNEALVEQYLTTADEDLWLRANPWSTGDALLAATDVGAKTTQGMDEFYGHTMVPPPEAEFAPEQYVDVSSYYGPYVLALDRTGNRFTDESESLYEDTLVQDAAERADGTVYYVMDQRLYDSTIHLGRIGTMVEKQVEAGATVVEADGLPELGAAMREEWGVNATRLVDTVETYNEAVRTGEDDLLDYPREANRVKLREPPFYGIEVQVSITYTNGGLDVDEDMNVLRRSASRSSYPDGATATDRETEATIDGLYAAGIDVGNFHRRRNVGPLIGCLVMGKVAAEAIAG